jgi:hypothetical protein
MDTKQAILFKVLINRFHAGSEESFLHKLSQDEAEEILKQSIAEESLSHSITWDIDLISSIHYSWLVPIIQQLNPNLHAPTVAAFPQPQSLKLKSVLKIKSIPKHLPIPTKTFLLHHLFCKWEHPKDLIPRQYLPKSPLSPLLDCSKSQIVDLIDMLAMHDLAETIRHIVDKKNLKWLYQHLPQKHQQFLRVCLHQKEKIVAPKIDIEKLNGDSKQLETALHARGILRLGKALCGQHPQFIWHLTHILDTGRGAAITKLYQEKAIPHVTQYLIQQLLLAINFLKKKSTP